MAVDRIELEKRSMIVGLSCVAVAAFCIILSTSTVSWCSVEFPDWTYFNSTRVVGIKGYNIGLWKLCALLYYPATNTSAQIGPKTQCKPVKMYPSQEDIQKNPQLDQTLLHYRRSASAVAIISCALLPLSIGFGFYAIKQPRYTFKRVAGAIQLINAGTVLITIEVFRSMLRYMNDFLQGYDWFKNKFAYGYSFVFAWIGFVLLVLAGVIYFLTSSKRRRGKALSEREAADNEQIHIGRI